jgi:hypothetical protein
MSDALPPSQEPKDNHDESHLPAPEPPLFSERWGELILTFFGSLLPSRTPEISRTEAVASGLEAAVGRVILATLLLSASIGVIVLWNWGARLIGDLLPYRIAEFGSSLQGMVPLILAIIACGATLLVSLTDVERKGRLLGWCCFAVVATGSLADDRAPLLAVLALLTGQFALHYFIDCALNRRDREMQWMRQTERDLARREGRRNDPRLLTRYSGLRGFEPDPPEGKPPPADTGRE